MSETPSQVTVKLRPRADGVGNGPVRGSDMVDVAPDDEDHSIASGQDALEELLTMDPKSYTEEIDMSPTYKNKWTVRGMDNELNARLLEQATRYRMNPRTKEQIRELDNVEFTRLIVAHCVVQPNLMAPQLFAKHHVDNKRPDLLIAKILLPGDLDRLASAIMRLSGFRDEMVTVAKNSSSEGA